LKMVKSYFYSMRQLYTYKIKVDQKFTEKIKGMSATGLQVYIEVLTRMDPDGRILVTTQDKDEIAEKLGIKPNTVTLKMNEILKHGLLSSPYKYCYYPNDRN